MPPEFLGVCRPPFPIISMQPWHPLFAHLLRPVLEGYYEVQTNVPVGDAPREADLVLLRRTSTRTLPFRGLWKALTTWNVLEFKGPTVSPRLSDLEPLVELGLGIGRRLNEERRKRGGRPLESQEVSFWYLVNRLGNRLLRAARHRLGQLDVHSPGVWRCTILQHLVFLVSTVALPVDEDSLPLHVVGKEPPEKEKAVADLVVAQPALWQQYGSVFATLHPSIWEEVRFMARTSGKKFQFDFRPAIKHLGLNYVIEQVGVKPIIDEIGIKRAVEEMGLKRVVDEVGVKRVIEEVGLDALLAHLTPSQRQELKRRLK
jgi:hypothetical protein